MIQEDRTYFYKFRKISNFIKVRLLKSIYEKNFTKYGYNIKYI